MEREGSRIKNKISFSPIYKINKIKVNLIIKKEISLNLIIYEK